MQYLFFNLSSSPLVCPAAASHPYIPFDFYINGIHIHWLCNWTILVFTDGHIESSLLAFVPFYSLSIFCVSIRFTFNLLFFLPLNSRFIAFFLYRFIFLCVALCALSLSQSCSFFLFHFFPPFCYPFRTNDYFIFNSILFYFRCSSSMVLFSVLFSISFTISPSLKFALQKWKAKSMGEHSMFGSINKAARQKSIRSLFIAAELCTLSLSTEFGCKKFIVYA